jgi:hypothetical protein
LWKEMTAFIIILFIFLNPFEMYYNIRGLRH